MVFDWDEVLSFEGETGPYVQYSHARLASILRKAGGPPADRAATVNWARLEDSAPLVLFLGRYPDVLRRSAKDAEPSILSQYLLELCRMLNAWYVGAPRLGGRRRGTAQRTSTRWWTAPGS